MSLTLSDFDYHLPDDRIAHTPARPRDSSRLLKIDRATGTISHHYFRDLPDLLRCRDLLVLNNTKVRPARLYGKKVGGTGSIEVFLVNSNPDGSWDVLVRPGKRVRPGTEIAFSGGVTARAEERHEELQRIRFNLSPADLYGYLDQHAEPPIPPYIKEYEPDRLRDDYQTIYAMYEGAVAAPTAGFHFTPEVFARLEQAGIDRAFVTLHVGLGTFQPVRDEHIEGHRMHGESFTLTADTALSVNQAKAVGHRVVAVGTTSTRVLETCAVNGQVIAREGTTDLFIIPGAAFHIVDALITNFHLPKSTLLMLVSAFAGRDLVLEAYKQAIATGYRFYSFGDAMLIE